MKHSKFIWILMGVITVIYIATLFVVRIKNPRNIQYQYLYSLATSLRDSPNQ